MGPAMKDAMAGICHAVSWHFDQSAASEGMKDRHEVTQKSWGRMAFTGSDTDYTTVVKLSLFTKYSTGRGVRL